MDSEKIQNSKRLAKNTIILYIRLLVTMLVTLYTSRIVLRELGVDDYGVYNVVGGFVGLFAIISGSLTNAISRFITFELGKKNIIETTKVFATAINIQCFLSLIVILIGESLGLWFLNEKINIPEDSIYAANWVFQCSIFSFVINLLSIPYNSDIIAHERMTAFAYISILEVLLKLSIVLLLIFLHGNKLIAYSIGMLFVSIIIRIVYLVYCKKNFEEANYHFVWEKNKFKEMLHFAGWNFFGNGAYVLNNQGVNILINLFFGVTMNTARGLAVQAETAIVGFVNNFSMALNPQITKSCASKDYEYMIVLMNRGTKYCAYIMFLFLVPFILESYSILKLWLGEVPAYTSIFLKWVMISMFFSVIGNYLYIGIMAIGQIKKYQLLVTSIGALVFPLTWLTYYLGASAVSTYIIYSIIYFSLNIIRVRVLKGLIGYKPISFVKDALLPIFIVGISSSIPTITLVILMPSSILRLFLTFCIGITSTILCTYMFGVTTGEKKLIKEKILSFKSKLMKEV